jgi:hypothetical protein
MNTVGNGMWELMMKGMEIAEGGVGQSNEV